MNKPIALLAFVLTAATLTAQDDVGVRFGLKLSPNMAFVQPETKTLKSNGAGLGYTFGLMLELPIGNSGNYRFATGLNLNNMKTKWKTDFAYYDALNEPQKTRELETDVALQYVELPLTIKLMTNEIGYMRYFAVVGAGNAFNVKAKADQVVPVYNSVAPTIVDKFEEQENENVQDDIALYKASLIVGAGAEYNFSGSTSVMFGITYNNGFTNILDIDGAKAKAHYVELSLGVFF
ncbi:MAG: PorT family protein [Flavobacteriales bacterium]|jgi:opacity protein-like surface antigen|nr:PorT family protein [Flavobacteriales bacterium]